MKNIGAAVNLAAALFLKTKVRKSQIFLKSEDLREYQRMCEKTRAKHEITDFI